MAMLFENSFGFRKQIFKKEKNILQLG